MRLLFATHNSHKVDEVRAILGQAVEVVSLADLGDHEEIPETGDTLQANALQKARIVYERHGIACFADDTGLEVEALNGAPGVYSARYAGASCNASDNCRKLLQELRGCTDRQARFRTVIALILADGKEHLFSGEVQGEILTEASGSEGFGYDPLFRPDGYHESFADMSAAQKNSISHRYRATQALADYLATID